MKNSYKRFAYFYDEVVTSDLNYDLWLEFVEPYLKKGDKILDLACGSGTFATMLKLKGFDSSGLDLSDEIIEIANEKKKINHLDIPFYVMDMTSFNLNEKYDVVTCFFDSINFLDNKNKIKKMLDTVYKHLNKDGYYIFDIASKVLLNEYDHHEFHKDYETFYVDWVSEMIDNDTLCHHIKIKDVDESFEEDYYEYYYNIGDVLDKRFEIIKIVGDFNDDLQDDDERILFVLKKSH